LNDGCNLIIWEDLKGLNQRFILQKWDYITNSTKFGKLVTNIIEHNRFLPKLSQNLLENLDDDEYYDVTIEVGNDPLHVKTFRAHMVILNCRSPYLRRILSTNKKKNEPLVHIKLPNILPETFEVILR